MNFTQYAYIPLKKINLKSFVARKRNAIGVSFLFMSDVKYFLVNLNCSEVSALCCSIHFCGYDAIPNLVYWDVAGDIF